MDRNCNGCSFYGFAGFDEPCWSCIQLGKNSWDDGCLVIEDEGPLEARIDTTLAGNTLVMEVYGDIMFGYTEVPKGYVAIGEEKPE